MFFVRTASVRDVKKIRPLLVETWHATYDNLYGVDVVNEICEEWHSEDEIKRRIEQSNDEYIVADDGQTIGGIAYAGGADENKVSKLHQLYVAPDLQGQGIGADLLIEIETSFPAARTMQLEVDKNNEAALGFYLRFGYKRASVTSDCAGTGKNIEALILEKSLDGWDES